MNAAAPLQNAVVKPQQSSNSGNVGLLLQRKCACGSPTPSLTGVCEECGSGKRLQAKLTIGASNDPLEQEADRVADLVLAASASAAVSSAPLRIQRLSGQSTGQFDTAPASVDRVLASPGKPLEPVLLQDMEQRFGYDFSHVRVHSGETAERSARDVNASAYTVGPNIVFGAGQFAPGSQEGERLIAHELTHVIQQSHAISTRTLQRQPKEAEVPTSHVAASRGASALAGIPYEKWSETIETQYRSRGDSLRANAIRACRTQGAPACLRILTIAEVHRLHALGKTAGGDKKKIEDGLVSTLPQLASAGPGLSPLS